MRTSINKKSDFDFIVLDNEGNAVDMPSNDFTIDLWTWGSKCRFRASSIGGVLKGCKSDNGKLRVYVDNPGFVPGRLVGEWVSYVSSEEYPDGTQRTCRYISDFGIDMVDGDSTTNEQQVLAMMQYIQGASAYEIACEYGYQGTEEEWLNSLSLESVNAANECRELMAQLSAAEDVRNANEQTRIANEQARVESEGSRSYEEDRRVDAERTRIHNESVRHNREEIRQDAENYRITHENSREGNETMRQNSETARAAAEEARVAAEESRQTAEQARETAEVSRIAAESSRDRTHDRLKAAMREYAEAESLRDESEAERREAEQYRIEYEQSRQSSEATRATNERSRTTAESQRVTAETARSNSESSRTTNETARQEAETVRQEAEQGRVTAEQQRADAEAARAEEFATFEGKITAKEDAANKVTSIGADADNVHYPSAKAVKDSIAGLDLQVEKTVVSANQFRNGGSGNGSNTYKVRTCGIDVRGKEKIIFTTDRPLSGNSHYMYECFFVKEATAIGQFFASNVNPSGFTYAGTQSGIAQNEIVVIPSEASAVVVGIYEMPNDGKEGDIVLRVADFNGYRVGYSVNIANSEMPSIYQAITDINSKNQEQDAELEKLITKTNTFVTTNSLRNGGSGNGSNAYKVRTCGIDVRGKSAIIFYTNRPLSGNSHYVYECVFAKEESAIGQFFASNENPNGFTLKAYAGIGQDDMLYIPENFSAVVIAIYEIPNDGKEGDIVLRVGNFSGYEIGYNYYTVEKELSATKDRVSALEVGVSELEDRVSELEDGGAYTRNIRKIIPLGAACRQRKSSNTSKDFQIIEVTDSHADTQAVLNAVNMANGFKTVDAIVHCGDMAGDYITPATTMSAYINAMKNSIKPWYNVIGNHEAGTYNMVGYVPSIQHMYNELIAPIVDAGYLTDGEYQVGKCHYYHDFAEYNIRLICVNEYDGDLAFDTEYWDAVAYDSSASAFAWGTQYNVGDIIKMPNYTEFCFKCVKTAITGSSIYGLSGQEPKYKEIPGSRMISQEQAQWFLNTLLNTPENYSIVIAMHNPFSDNAVVDLTKKFSDKKANVAIAQNSMENDFFADIIDAYVNGRAYSDYIAFKGNASYRNTLTNSEGKAYAYYLTADFSKKNSNTKFMCYIGGHVHRDLVLNHATYKTQWQVNPVCAATSYHQSPTSDIRRSNVDGLDYDSITSISFDTSNRAISLVKIGVDVTENMENRDFEKIVL